jgi:predicted transcriptional regulator
VPHELELQKIVADVAAAYLANSRVTPAEIPNVIKQIASSILTVGAPESAASPETEEPAKATRSQIRRSITYNALISLEDNKPYKTLRRHLAAKGLTPDQYRGKWGLPRDYPMVAPSYSEARSRLAKARGLGGAARSAPTAPRKADEASIKRAPKRRGAPSRRGRPKAAAR